MELKVFIHAEWQRWDKSWRYYAFNCDMSDSGYVLLEERTIHFQSPADKDLRVRMAQVLKDGKTKVHLDAEAKLNALDAQIQELLALEDMTEVTFG